MTDVRSDATAKFPLKKMTPKHRANSLNSLANNPIDLMRVYAGGDER